MSMLISYCFILLQNTLWSPLSTSLSPATWMIEWLLTLCCIVFAVVLFEVKWQPYNRNTFNLVKSATFHKIVAMRLIKHNLFYFVCSQLIMKESNEILINEFDKTTQKQKDKGSIPEEISSTSIPLIIEAIWVKRCDQKTRNSYV